MRFAHALLVITLGAAGCIWEDVCVNGTVRVDGRCVLLDGGTEAGATTDAAADASDDASCVTREWWRDDDEDDFGVESDRMIACDQPAGYAATAGDCNDDCPSCFPGAAEICDGEDNDCDDLSDGEAADATCGWRCVAGACEDVRDVAAGGTMTCVVVAQRGASALAPGAVWCWGGNEVGQLGDGTLVDRAEPAQVPGAAGALDVEAGSGHVCTITVDRRMQCWGWNSFGQLPVGSMEEVVFTPATAPDASDVRVMGFGFYHSCVRTLAGIRCWGGMFGEFESPDVVFNDAADVFAGAEHSCGAALGTRLVRCWGANRDGQLGDGTAVSRMMPEIISWSGRAAQLALGHDHSCLVAEDGELWCWGSNAEGQLTFADPADTLMPTRVVGMGPIAEADAGVNHTCVIATSGSVSCWGGNEFGQLAIEGSTSSTTPVPVDLPLPVTRLSVGAYHACAIDEVGGLWCWGQNSFGQLGVRTVTPWESATRVVP